MKVLSKRGRGCGGGACEIAYLQKLGAPPRLPLPPPPHLSPQTLAASPIRHPVSTIPNKTRRVGMRLGCRQRRTEKILFACKAQPARENSCTVEAATPMWTRPREPLRQTGASLTVLPAKSSTPNDHPIHFLIPDSLSAQSWAQYIFVDSSWGLGSTWRSHKFRFVLPSSTTLSRELRRCISHNHSSYIYICSFRSMR